MRDCFVIGPIGPVGSETRTHADQFLRFILRPVLDEHGYRPIRADTLSEPGLITTQIIQHVTQDPLVVADLTFRNPNVYYELALRHVIKEPLVQLISDGEELPFDIAAMRTIRFDLRNLEAVEDAKVELSRQIGTAQESSIETPISLANALRALNDSADPVDRSIPELAESLGAVHAELAEIRVQIERLFARPLAAPVTGLSAAQDQGLGSREFRYSAAKLRRIQTDAMQALHETRETSRDQLLGAIVEGLAEALSSLPEQP